MFYFLLDPRFLMFMAPVIILTIYAQTKVKSTYAYYSRIGSRSGLTGAELVRRIIQHMGLPVSVEVVKGRVTDHYDPRTNTLRLSEDNYNGRSIAALGVATHELGHAIQHAHNYAPLSFRNSIVPVVSFGSRLAPIVLIGGFLLRNPAVISFAIAIFALAVVFSIITLPVEFNASRRALKVLSEGGFLQQDELAGARKVLGAAALTYVAAAVAAIVQLIYLLTFARRR